MPLIGQRKYKVDPTLITHPVRESLMDYKEGVVDSRDILSITKRSVPSTFEFGASLIILQRI